MQRIETDICIVGSSFSGTFVAHKLMGKSIRVHIIERGAHLTWERLESNYVNEKEVYDDPEFHNYDFTNVGKVDYNYSGYHAVGGASMVWFGNSIRKVPNDFLLKSIYGVGDDWPISYDDLEPYFQEAEEEMRVSGPSMDLFTQYRKKPFPLPPFDLPPGALELNRRFQDQGLEFSPSHKARNPIDADGRNACCGAGSCGYFCPVDARYNCLTTHLEEQFKSENIKIIDQLTVTRLYQQDNRIVEAHAIDRQGSVVRIKADIFVLASNAIENARILLLSQHHAQDTHFRTRSEALGRYLADQVGILIPFQLPFSIYTLYDKTVQSSHSLSFYDGNFRSHRSGIIVELWLSNLRMGIKSTDQARTIVFDLIKKGYFGQGLRNQFFRSSVGQGIFCLEMEMLPDKNNQIRLHRTRKDRNGDPIAEFNFSIWDQEYMQNSVNYYSKFFKRAINSVGGTVSPFQYRNSFEHMLGTCRMGTDPGDSVVDSNLKSHDHDNLYIVGSSAFTTIGQTNPTLTISALALRCGDHLVDRLKLA
jgi:choline dehydrogenase-like flavoprotein